MYYSSKCLDIIHAIRKWCRYFMLCAPVIVFQWTQPQDILLICTGFGWADVLSPKKQGSNHLLNLKSSFEKVVYTRCHKKTRTRIIGFPISIHFSICYSICSPISWRLFVHWFRVTELSIYSHFSLLLLEWITLQFKCEQNITTIGTVHIFELIP